MEKNFSKDFTDFTNIIVFNSLGLFFLNFLIPFIAVELLDITGLEMGILFSAETGGFFISSLFVGILVDKYSKKNLLIIGSTGRGLAYMTMYYAIIILSLPLLLISNLMLGLLSAFYLIPLDTIVADKSLSNKRSEAYGIKKSSQGKGTFIGAFIGFFILLQFNPDIPLMYIAIPIFGLANFYASWKYYHVVTSEKIDVNKIIVTNDKETNLKSTKVTVFLIIGSGLILFSILIESITSNIYTPFLIPYFLNTLSNDPELATLIYIPVGLVSILFAQRLGKFIDEINFYLGLTIFGLLGAILTFFMISTSSIIEFSVFLTLDEAIGIFFSLFVSNIFSSISIRHRGKIMGMSSFFTNFGAMVGPFVGGILWEYSIKGPFIASIGLGIIVIPFFLLSLYFLKHIFK